MTVFLVGCGPDTIRTADLLEPFVAEMASRARRRGRQPRLALAVFDHEGSGEHFLPAYVDALTVEGPLEVVPVYLRRGDAVDPAPFVDVDGIVVGGGPTPDYLTGFAASGDTIRTAVTEGVPYLGFSAGAMVAARRALVGGHRMGRQEVCPEDWSEGLAQLTLRDGLGLVEPTVDVHTAQAGTLGRTVALVESGLVPDAVGIDEDTCLMIGTDAQRQDTSAVTGSGSAWFVRAAEPGSAVVIRRGSATAA